MSGIVRGATTPVFGTMTNSGHASNRPGANFGPSMPIPEKSPGRFLLGPSLSSMQRVYTTQEALNFGGSDRDRGRPGVYCRNQRSSFPRVRRQNRQTALADQDGGWVLHNTDDFEGKNGKQYVVLVATGGSYLTPLPATLYSPMRYRRSGRAGVYEASNNFLCSGIGQRVGSDHSTRLRARPRCRMVRAKPSFKKMRGVPRAHRGHFETLVSKEWDQVVNQMVSRGADLSDEEIDTVIEYLSKNYGPLDQTQHHRRDARERNCCCRRSGVVSGASQARSGSHRECERGENGNFKSWKTWRRPRRSSAKPAGRKSASHLSSKSRRDRLQIARTTVWAQNQHGKVPSGPTE